MTISLIIPTFNRYESLIKTLNSLSKCAMKPDEIIISDQNDKELFNKVDLLIQEIKTAINFQNIIWKHVYCKEIGITISRNVALEEATGDVVVFSDDDVLFPKDFFSNVHEKLKNPSVAMIGGMNFKKFPTHKSNIIKLLLLFLMGLNGSLTKKGSVSTGLFGRYPNDFNGIIQTQWAMGYCMIFRRDLLKKSNLLFDTRLTRYGYGEDLELTYMFYKWCKRHGFKCILSSDIGVYHLVSSENRQSREDAYIRVFVNRQHINYVLHGNSLIHLALLSYSNFWYRVIFAHIDGDKTVYRSYRRFLKHKSRIKKGLLDDSCYE